MNTKPQKQRSNRMLMPERPLVLFPSLAKAIGTDEAIVMQQLHFHAADPNNGRQHNGEQWIYKTYEGWQANDFPHLNTRKLQRIFLKLEKKKLVVSCQPEGRNNRRKYYRIDYDRFDEFLACAERTKFGTMDGTKNGRSSLTETTCTKTTYKKGKGRFRDSSKRPYVFVPRYPYPVDEDDMYAQLELHGKEWDPDHDGNFFQQHSANNWTLPNGEPIYDWMATYAARLEKTSP
jgi:hypothetical protein